MNAPEWLKIGNESDNEEECPGNTLLRSSSSHFRIQTLTPLTELFKWAADKLLAQQESLSSSSSASNSSENSAADPSSNSCSGDRPFDIKLVAPPFTSMRAALKAGDEGSGEGATLESAGCCSARLNLEWL